MELKVYPPMTFAESDALINSEEFNRPFVEYTNQVLKMCTENLNEQDLKEFNEWYSGKPNPDFWGRRSDGAYNAIMTAISYGLG
jgi:hypothetical protein